MSMISYIKSRFAGKRISTDALPAGGRSSEPVDTFGSSLNILNNAFGIVNPQYPMELLRHLEILASMIPNFSDAVDKYINIGNSGHKVFMKGTDEKENDIIKHINKKAAILTNGGIDLFINQLFKMICIYGGFSFEAVLKASLDEIDSLAIIPFTSIRFKYEEGKYRLYQQANAFFQAATAGNFNLIKLNELTCFFSGLPGAGNSPYPEPPFISALKPTATQLKMGANIDKLLDKAALLGFMDIGIKPLMKKPNENDVQYNFRYQKYVDDIDKRADTALKKGRFTHPEDICMKFEAIGVEPRGFDSLWRTNEEQMFNAFKIDAALMGRSYSTTETYAGVVYEVFLKKCNNMRMLIKRALERLWGFEFLLKGISLEGLSIQFNQDKSLNPNLEALAENYQRNGVFKELGWGMISPQQAASKRGYTDYYDEELFKLKAMAPEQNVQEYSYDPRTGQYTLENVYKAPKSFVTVSHASTPTDEEKALEYQKQLEINVNNYLNAVLPYYNEIKDQVAGYAIKWAKEHIEALSHDSSIFLPAIREYMETLPTFKDIQNKESWFRKVSEPVVIDAGKYFFEKDQTIWGGQKPTMQFHFGEGDLQAMKFYQGLDQFHFSSFLKNPDFGSKINQFANEFISRGEALFGQWTESAEKEFIRLFGAALQGDIEFQARRIITTSISNIRLRSHIIQLHDAGFKYGRINGVLEACKICRPLRNKKILIGTARESIRKFESAKTPEEALQSLIDSNFTTEEEAASSIDDNNVIKPGKIPPFHIYCKCFLEGVFDEK